MSVRIVVAAQNFGSRFQALLHGNLQKMVQPGETIQDCAIVRAAEPSFVREHLLALLETTPRPTALISLALRPDPKTVADFRAAGVPMVLVDEEAEGASTVACDNEVGGYLAGERLVRSGRRSIAVVAGPGHHFNAVLRVRGVTRALAEHGLALPAGSMFETPMYTRKEAEAAMTTLLRRGPKVDAVFCASGDACALGLIAVAREARLDIPRQLAIVGYDDLAVAAISTPPLTTIRQPLEAVAREAYRLATRCTAEILATPKRSLLDPVLVERGSA